MKHMGEKQSQTLSLHNNYQDIMLAIIFQVGDVGIPVHCPLKSYLYLQQ